MHRSIVSAYHFWHCLCLLAGVLNLRSLEYLPTLSLFYGICCYSACLSIIKPVKALSLPSLTDCRLSHYKQKFRSKAGPGENVYKKMSVKQRSWRQQRGISPLIYSFVCSIVSCEMRIRKSSALQSPYSCELQRGERRASPIWRHFDYWSAYLTAVWRVDASDAVEEVLIASFGALSLRLSKFHASLVMYFRPLQARWLHHDMCPTCASIIQKRSIQEPCLLQQTRTGKECFSRYAKDFSSKKLCLLVASHGSQYMSFRIIKSELPTWAWEAQVNQCSWPCLIYHFKVKVFLICLIYVFES